MKLFARRRWPLVEGTVIDKRHIKKFLARFDSTSVLVSVDEYLVEFLRPDGTPARVAIKQQSVRLPVTGVHVGETVPRAAALNVFKAIPHFIVLFVFLVGAAVVAIIGWFAVLFTGAWPHGMRGFLVRVSNYQYRIWAYVTMVENDYPKFGLPSA